jgi:hypothetical protein
VQPPRNICSAAGPRLSPAKLGVSVFVAAVRIEIMARRNMSDERFGTSREVLDAFHYLAQDVIKHPLVINPRPMTFNMTLLFGGEIHFGWDMPDSAPWVELSTYVRKLAMLEKENTYISKVLNILARDYEALRPEIQGLQRAVKDWRGSKKAEFFTQAEGSDSLSVTSTAISSMPTPTFLGCGGRWTLSPRSSAWQQPRTG